MRAGIEYGIRIIGDALGNPVPDSSNRWVSFFDPDAHEGRGQVNATTDASGALRFGSMVAALETWQQQSSVRPQRDDGKPNRPLTAYSVSVEALP